MEITIGRVVLSPYEVEITDEQHFAAWTGLRKSIDGKVIVNWLHQALGEEMSKTCPFTEMDKRSAWLAAHDARKSVLLELCAVAVGDVRDEVRVEGQPHPS